MFFLRFDFPSKVPQLSRRMCWLSLLLRFLTCVLDGGLGHFCMHSPLLSGILFGAVVHILFGCDFPLSRQTRAPREWAPALFRSLLTPFTPRFSVPFAIRGTTEADPAFVVRSHIQSTHLSGFLFPCRHLAPFLLFSVFCSPRLASLYSHLSFPLAILTSSVLTCYSS